MKNKFFGYIPYDEDTFKMLWKESTFVLDANILLNLYRYSKNTKKQVLDALIKIKDRIWIPYNIAQEFFNNRLNVIYEQNNIYNEVRKKINLNPIKDEIRKIRHTTLSEEKEKLLSIVEKCRQDIEYVINNDEKKNKDKKADKVLEQILIFIGNNVGEKNSDKEIKEYIKEIDKRYEKEIPPGYKDAKKSKGDEKYGDCINWFNILSYAKAENKNIIYITDDNKEDWFLIEHGQKNGPRMELLQEFYEKTQGQKIYI